MGSLTKNNRVESNSASRQNSSPESSSHKLWLAVGGLIVFCLVTAFLLLGGLNGFTNTAEADVEIGDEVRILPVRVAPAEFVMSITQKRKYTGTIRAKQQASLGFELTGRVENVLADEGDVVKKGQVLAILDTQTLRARQSATRASLTGARAVLAELRAGPRQQTIDSMRAQLAEAESNLKLADINLQRRKRLQGTQAISDSEFDRALYNHQSARSRVDSIAEQLNELQAGTRIEKVNAQAANVGQLESSLKEIDVQIEKSKLTAPFAGKIVSRMVDPGSIASVAVPVLKIVDVENLEAVIGVPFETSKGLTNDQSFEILVNDSSYASKLLAKIQELDIATRTQNLIFQLPSAAQANVIPGQLCQIEIETSIQNSGYWVPAAALTNGIRGLWSLMIVDPDSSRSVRCDVEVVYTDGDRALVRGTLKKDASVIIEGTHRIVEGQKVKPVRAGVTGE